MPERAHLTDLEQLLLLAVLRLGEGAYGAAIQDELEANASRRVSLGSIHMTLGRLEERGLTWSSKGRPQGGRGGKARRIYAVRPEGRMALEWNRDVMNTMWGGVPTRPSD